MEYPGHLKPNPLWNSEHPALPDQVFRDLLDLMMVINDPGASRRDADGRICNFLTAEARRRGFNSWYDAYHHHMKCRVPGVRSSRSR